MEQHLGGAPDLVGIRDIRGLARHLGTLAPTRVERWLSMRNSDRKVGWSTPALLRLFCHGTARTPLPEARLDGPYRRPEQPTRSAAWFCCSRTARPTLRRRPSALSYAVQLPFARTLARAGEGDGLAVHVLHYRCRGWNADDAHPAEDAAWAADEVQRLYGDVPVCLVGHGMGGRAALQAAGHGAVTSVLAMAPWLPERTAADPEPVKQLMGRRVLIVHGTNDERTDPELSYRLAERAKKANRDTCALRSALRRARVAPAPLRSGGAGGRLRPRLALRPALRPSGRGRARRTAAAGAADAAGRRVRAVVAALRGGAPGRGGYRDREHAAVRSPAQAATAVRRRAVRRRASPRSSSAPLPPSTVAHPAAATSRTSQTVSVTVAAVAATPDASRVAAITTTTCAVGVSVARVARRRCSHPAPRRKTVPTTSRVSATASWTVDARPGLAVVSRRSSPASTAHTTSRQDSTVTRSPGDSFSQTGPSPRIRTLKGGSAAPPSSVTQLVISALVRPAGLGGDDGGGHSARQFPFSGTAASEHGRAARKSAASESAPGSSANRMAAASTSTEPTTDAKMTPCRLGSPGGCGDGRGEADGSPRHSRSPVPVRPRLVPRPRPAPSESVG